MLGAPRRSRSDSYEAGSRARHHPLTKCRSRCRVAASDYFPEWIFRIWRVNAWTTSSVSVTQITAPDGCL